MTDLAMQIAETQRLPDGAATPKAVRVDLHLASKDVNTMAEKLAIDSCHWVKIACHIH
jgi:hypothetical protein